MITLEELDERERIDNKLQNEEFDKLWAALQRLQDKIDHTVPFWQSRKFLLASVVVAVNLATMLSSVVSPEFSVGLNSVVALGYMFINYMEKRD